ncbi:hypothetical protein [Aquicella siphonis]|nr:hypothetical protein [Aquicella siphonis]
MQREELEILQKYIPAQGPDGLKRVLEELLEKCKSDREFAAQEHYILYQLGGQKSLMKVDMSQAPFQFWYYDLLGRPMTKKVEETIADFLWDKGGERERYLQNAVQGEQQ